MLRTVAVYFGTACAVSWGVLFAATGFEPGHGEASTVASSVLYMTGPLMGALVVQLGIKRRPLRELGLTLDVTPLWMAMWILPLGVALAAVGTSLLFPGVSFDSSLEGLLSRFADTLPPERLSELREELAQSPVHPFFQLLLQGLIFGPTLNAALALGEELGWRGVLHQATRPLGVWPTALVSGVLWGIWHAPLVLIGSNYPHQPVAGLFFMIAFTTLWAPWFTVLRELTGSVAATAVLHGSLNAFLGLPLLVLAGGSELVVSTTGLAGMLVIGAADLLLWRWWRRRHASPGSSDAQLLA